jgi:release factor glutamine methyltransferase
VITYRACLNHIKDALRSVTDEADIEAEILLFDTFKLTKSKFFLIQDNSISDMTLYSTLDTLLKERLIGKPLAYVLGYWDFFGSRYFVDPGVLVPRPETELLVEHALAILDRLTHKYRQSDITVLELGVGTGIVSIEIAKRYPDCIFHGWDISDTAMKDAVRVSLCNLYRHNTRSYPKL